MRFLVRQPDKTRPDLVVDTVQQADEGSAGTLREAMFQVGCANGLLFDQRTCWILRDHFESMAPNSIKVDAVVPIDDLLNRFGGGRLEERVQRWLASMAAEWNRTLPLDADLAAKFIPDIVAATSGSIAQPLSGHEVLR